MKIGILADSHDHVVNLKKAITFFNAEKVELIYHCGDWVSPFVFEFLYWECKPEAPVKGVFGNNEGDRFRIVERISTHKLPVVIRQHTLAEEVDDKRIIIYHGQDKAITSTLINSGTYDLVLTGHTHLPLTEMVGKTLHINPGTTCDAAQSKIIETPTVAIYNSNFN